MNGYKFLEPLNNKIAKLGVAIPAGVSTNHIKIVMEFQNYLICDCQVIGYYEWKSAYFYRRAHTRDTVDENGEPILDDQGNTIPITEGEDQKTFVPYGSLSGPENATPMWTSTLPPTGAAVPSDFMYWTKEEGADPSQPIGPNNPCARIRLKNHDELVPNDEDN